MAWDGPSATPTDAAAARLLAVQLLSPAFPTGAFAYSSGLEWAMAAGLVRDAGGLSDWIDDSMTHGAGRSDAVLLALALRPGADHALLDDWARALCLSAERLAETLDQGGAFARTAAPLIGTAPDPCALPIAIGRACAGLGLPPAELVALFLHGQALNAVQVAVRFLPLGQSAGQAVLARLAPALLRQAARACTAAGPEDLGTCAAGAELAQLHHETMETRMFRT